MRIGALRAMAVVLGCTCAAAPKPAPGPSRAPAQAAKPAAATDYCGAGHLPRVADKSFGDGGLAVFLAGAAKGTVAVAWDGTRARVIDRCRLDGRYVEAKGNGAWRFRATNRLLFRTDEIAGECRTATHLVAAYITTRNAGQMNGILVPLPCPSVKDPEPASGCIARGLSGPGRRKRAETIMVEIPPDRVAAADPAKVLEVFALIPDQYWGVTYATARSGDCPLIRQGQWLELQYNTDSINDRGDQPDIVELRDAAHRPPPPKLNWQAANFNCIYTPVFMQCFPGQFEPIFSDAGHWQPVEPEQP